MSRLVGKGLSEELFRRLSGEDIAAHMGKAIVIVTVDEGGSPHPAMLSYHEVVAKDRSTIDLAVGKTSATAGNLRRTGKITLLVTDSGVNFYLKGKARELRESMDGAPFMSLFRVESQQLLEDQEPDAVITSGVTFRRPKGEMSPIVERIFEGVRKERLE